jgi:hypothetical protein
VTTKGKPLSPEEMSEWGKEMAESRAAADKAVTADELRDARQQHRWGHDVDVSAALLSAADRIEELELSQQARNEDSIRIAEQDAQIRAMNETMSGLHDQATELTELRVKLAAAQSVLLQVSERFCLICMLASHTTPEHERMAELPGVAGVEEGLVAERAGLAAPVVVQTMPELDAYKLGRELEEEQANGLTVAEGKALRRERDDLRAKLTEAEQDRAALLAGIAAATEARDHYRTEWESACERLRNTEPSVVMLAARVSELIGERDTALKRLEAAERARETAIDACASWCDSANEANHRANTSLARLEAAEVVIEQAATVVCGTDCVLACEMAWKYLKTANLICTCWPAVDMPPDGPSRRDPRHILECPKHGAKTTSDEVARDAEAAKEKT